jgi:hypothetical protein
MCRAMFQRKAMVKDSLKVNFDPRQGSLDRFIWDFVRPAALRGAACFTASFISSVVIGGISC